MSSVDFKFTLIVLFNKFAEVSLPSIIYFIPWSSVSSLVAFSTVPVNTSSVITYAPE